jgi:hypothetical protein
MYRLAYRNFGNHESLVVNHAVAAGSGGGIRWYEIQNPNGTPTLAQQSTFAPDSNFRWMGSMAMDLAEKCWAGVQPIWQQHVSVHCVHWTAGIRRSRHVAARNHRL